MCSSILIALAFLFKFSYDEITSLTGLPRISPTRDHPSPSPAKFCDLVLRSCLQGVPSFPLYAVCHVEMFSVMLLPHQIVLLLPSRVCVWRLNSGKVMVAWGSRVSCREGERRGEGFAKKRRNSSDWQMKSVHSSEAAPYRQPVKQSQALNGGQDNGVANYWKPSHWGLERQTKKWTPSVWLRVKSCLFPHLDYRVSFAVPNCTDNPSTAWGILLFMSTAVFYYLVLKLSCKCTNWQSGDWAILNQVKPAAQTRVRLPADLFSEAWWDSVLVLLRWIKHTPTHLFFLPCYVCMHFCPDKHPLPNTLELLHFSLSIPLGSKLS